MRYGHRLLGLHRDDRGRVSGATIGDLDGQTHSVQAGLVVGADGRHSLVARLTGAARLRSGRAATATVYGHWPGLGDHDYRWLYGPDASAGVISTNGGACVFATVSAAAFAATFRPDVAAGFQQVLRRLDPALASRRGARRRRSPGCTASAGSPAASRGVTGPDGPWSATPRTSRTR